MSSSGMDGGIHIEGGALGGGNASASALGGNLSASRVVRFANTWDARLALEPAGWVVVALIGRPTTFLRTQHTLEPLAWHWSHWPD